MKRNILLLALILMTACIFLSGCTPEYNAILSETETDAAGTITLAVVYPVQDIDGSTDFWKGIELAVREINENGGIDGRPVRVIKKDDQGSVTEGLTIAQALAEDKEITAVIGHWNSRVTLPAAAVYENGGKLMMTPASTSPEITARKRDYIFQQIIDDTRIGQEIALFASRKGFKRIAAFYAPDAYGRGLVNSFSEQAAAGGIDLIDRVSVLGSDLNVERIVDKWQALDVEALFMADVLPEAGTAIKRLREAGFNLPVLGATGLDRAGFLQYGQLVEGSYVPTFFNPHSSRPEVEDFTAAYQQEYGVLPDVWAAQAYDTVRVLQAAINQAGTSAADKVAEVLHDLQDWPGVTGNLSFSQKGAVYGQKMFIKVVNNGRFEFIEECGTGKGVD